MFLFIFFHQTLNARVFQNEEKRNLSLGGHVGFDSLPHQLVSKSVTQGFCFNILCVGEYRTTIGFTAWFVSTQTVVAPDMKQTWNLFLLLQCVWKLTNNYPGTELLNSLFYRPVSAILRGDWHWQVHANEHALQYHVWERRGQSLPERRLPAAKNVRPTREQRPPQTDHRWHCWLWGPDQQRGQVRGV